MRIVLIGPPGCGKGTQAAILSDKLAIPIIATGDLLRARASEPSPLGLNIAAHLDHGTYVPDRIVDPLVKEKLREIQDGPGFILDGYPRTKEQALALDVLLEDASTPLDRVLAFEVERSELITRIHLRGKRSGRSDDTEEVIGARMDAYHSLTEPVLKFYEDKGLLVTIDAMATVDEVTTRAMKALVPML